MAEETFYRPDELRREPHHIPAATYNLAYLLLKRSPQGCVFVPIRSLQYLAVLDEEEFIFVDREARSLIELSWQGFRPQIRRALEEPVPYEVVYYREKGSQTMRRLPVEFYKALQTLYARQQGRQSAGAGDVIPWPGNHP